jgi:hypothetical protein
MVDLPVASRVYEQPATGEPLNSLHVRQGYLRFGGVHKGLKIDKNEEPRPHVCPREMECLVLRIEKTT